MIAPCLSHADDGFAVFSAVTNSHGRAVVRPPFRLASRLARIREPLSKLSSRRQSVLAFSAAIIFSAIRFWRVGARFDPLHRACGKSD